MAEVDPSSRSIIGAGRSIADALIAALLAPGCAVCDELLDRPSSGCVCPRCWRGIIPITPPFCERCGDPLARVAHVDRNAPCASCRSRPSPIDRCRAIGEYDGVLREIVHALKYKGRRSLARPLAVRMRARGADLLDSADVVVPVPLHWWRQYRRGFNQACDLARSLGMPVADVLIRTRRTRAQVELPADRRRTNVRGAFRLGSRRSRTLIAGRTIVLVDDVSTTGATLEECAKVLKEAGAANVYALTAARVISRPPPR